MTLTYLLSHLQVYWCQNNIVIFKRKCSKMALPVIYHSLEEALTVLKDNKKDHENAVSELLEIYEKTKDVSNKSILEGDKKYPLIVLEGLDGCGKTTVGRRLAKKVNGENWRTPPNSISHLRPFFDDNKLLRTAYYALGNYIAAMEVSVLQRKSTVIMDRFWHSTCAFAVAQVVVDHPGEYSMPPAGDKTYVWPFDLAKPDMVLLLNVSESVRRQRHSRRNTTNTDQEKLLVGCDTFRNNVIQAYKNMVDPSVEFINGDLPFNKVIPEIIRKVNAILKIDIENLK